MNHSNNEISDPLWYQLFGYEIFTVVIVALLAPSLWAFQLLHSGHILFGAAIFIAWAALDSWILWALHVKKYLRLIVSIPCTLIGIVAAFVVARSA